MCDAGLPSSSAGSARAGRRFRVQCWTGPVQHPLRRRRRLRRRVQRGLEGRGATAISRRLVGSSRAVAARHDTLVRRSVNDLGHGNAPPTASGVAMKRPDGPCSYRLPCTPPRVANQAACTTHGSAQSTMSPAAKNARTPPRTCARPPSDCSVGPRSRVGYRPGRPVDRGVVEDISAVNRLVPAARSGDRHTRTGQFSRSSENKDGSASGTLRACRLHGPPVNHRVADGRGRPLDAAAADRQFIVEAPAVNPARSRHRQLLPARECGSVRPLRRPGPVSV